MKIARPFFVWRFSWLGIKNDYRTLVGVEGLDIIEKEDDGEAEEDRNV